ncbi:MAG: hypothetical protein GC179_26255 [Anaerolineaceae bacterium]|nr:hypothetical protein [Anaerolineaceae bacterium]
MTYEDDELKEIKRQVDAKLWRRGLLGLNFIAWLIGTGILAVVDAAAVEIVAVTWFGLVLFHGMMVILWERRDHEIAVEVERRAQARGSEKLKRDRLYRLSDDGELVEVEDEDDTPAKLHR